MKPLNIQLTGKKSADAPALKKLANLICKGGLGILPTDTLYGIVGSALDRVVVTEIYKLKGRDNKKPFIILIASVKDLKIFGIELKAREETILSKLWPGAVSVILPCPFLEFQYLHRGQMSLAFRLPADKNLRRLLAKTGPMVAPSANPQGKNPAKNIAEAKFYFKQNVAFYADAGEKISLPSTLLELKNGKIKILRTGVGIK